ncbi:MAG: nucleotidyltransferase domain-containing protein [Euryarchaeota archaeon]|nr:nucleotidyltransferase domain-containing protein [Euryarchaeota archaeon]
MHTDTDIRSDLLFLESYEVVIFGSYANKTANKRSDIDIAVITRMSDRARCIEIWKDLLGRAPPIYDIRIFELLPLQIKISVIENYRVVFGNKLDISEYFYNFRKMWRDAKHRFEENRFRSAREKIEAIKRYKQSYLVQHIDSSAYL